MRRRDLAALPLAAAAASGQAAPKLVPRLGIDLFSLRTQGWTGTQLLEYAAQQGASVVHFSELRFLGGLDKPNLEKIRRRGDELGVRIEAGMRSVCPSSKAFDPAQGTAEQQIMKMIDVATTLGSPIIRCFLGTFADRQTPPGIEAHIENTARVLRSVKSRIQDANLKVAIENHAGDMQARELKLLVEEAGKDFTGVTLDSGNPVWAIEDPHLTLETLHPYVLTSHVRDSSLWRTPEGIAVQWRTAGEGNIGLERYLRRFSELCPRAPISLEIINIPVRIYKIYKPAFWRDYRTTPAWEFSRFLALAEQGKPLDPLPKLDPEAAKAKERADLEASIAWTKRILQ